MATPVSTDMARGNRILRALNPADAALLQPLLEPVKLKLRQRLQVSHRRITEVYFLESGLASVVAVGNGERRQAEVGMIGHEGMTGLPIVLGTDRAPCNVFMQIEGQGHCIDALDFRALLDKRPTMRRCFLLFAHVFAMQSSFTALANAKGKLAERLARWLLMADDRLEGDELMLTHEFLALMIGVRRAGVTTALRRLESQGLIDRRRGSLAVVDRQGLEQSADGLYGAPEAEFERVFG